MLSCHDRIEMAWGMYENVEDNDKLIIAQLLICGIQLLDKNRPFGAQKSLEPCLILTGESLNDTSCLNLRTWCQADANLLAGDVLFCPFPSHAPFSIHLHFYCRTDLKWIFLADSTGVCMSKNESHVLGSSLYL